MRKYKRYNRYNLKLDHLEASKPFMFISGDAGGLTPANFRDSVRIIGFAKVPKPGFRMFWTGQSQSLLKGTKKLRTENLPENLPPARVQSIFSKPSCGQPPPRCRHQRTAFWHDDHPKSYP